MNKKAEVSSLMINKCQNLYNNLIPIKEISRKLNISEYNIKKSIILKKLWKTCPYCNKRFNNKEFPNIFHRQICCGSEKCKSKQRSNYIKINMKEYQKEYKKIWDIKNRDKIRELQNKWAKINYIKNKDKFIIKNKRRRTINNNKENIRRKKLGLPLIGENYKKETEMIYYIKNILKKYEITIHNRTILKFGYGRGDFLELDVYIPKLKLGFEYMGEQHYSKQFLDNMLLYYKKINPKREIRSYKKLRYNDRLKEKLCKLKGIKLIKIKYNENLSEQLIIKRLKDEGIKYEI